MRLINAYISYSYTLNYFTGDYKAISTPAAIMPLPLSLGVTGQSLYKGNISSIALNIPQLGEAQLYGYHYDQLNRLTKMDAFTGLNTTTNVWTPIATDNYKDPKFFNSKSRFGKGFYVSNDMKTTFLELEKHGAKAAATIKYTLEKPKLLNATGPVLNLTTHTAPKMMGMMAKSLGLDGIMYNSVVPGASGTNVAPFNNFQKLTNGKKIK